MENNPLKSHFRQPELYITLPSEGKFWPEGSIRIPVNGELAVYSMTAADEISLLTPDALMNGDATVKLIQNCIPGILDAWQTPSTDLESLLIAIRIASNGHSIDIETSCPKCNESAPYSLDLRYLISKFDVSMWSQSLKISDLIFKFKPLNYLQQNQYDVKLFQFRKKISQANLIEDLDVRSQTVSSIVTEFNKAELSYLINTIESIRTSTDSVDNPEFITEFILNCDKKIYNQVRDYVEKLKDTVKCSSITLTCSECNHQYKTEISLDYASFFE